MSYRDARDDDATGVQDMAQAATSRFLPKATVWVSWSSVVVSSAARGATPMHEVAGPDRLALLYLWYRDDRAPIFRSAEVVFHTIRGAPVASARGVGWAGFPWADAVSALGALKARNLVATSRGSNVGG
jgi:hypothetical protein